MSAGNAQSRLGAFGCLVVALTAPQQAGGGQEPVPLPADTAVVADTLNGPLIPVATPQVGTPRLDTAVRASIGEWVPVAMPNGPEETYLRYLQIAGLVPPYPWSLRGFSHKELKRLAAREGTHPWSATWRFTSADHLLRGIPLTGDLRFNARFPYGSNDGAVWAGRGATVSATGGAVVMAGPLSLSLAPIAFVTQNAGFQLMDNGETGRLRYGDGQRPRAIDRPQRFGDGRYAAFDPGNSMVRLVLGPLHLGAGTANNAWGPLEQFPFVLGTNAPGFAHGFAGTSSPVDVWLARLHVRVIWGRLEQSEYSPVEGGPRFVSEDEPGTRRFASGAVIIIQPRGVSGLEVGLARFFHSIWPESGIPASYFRKPLESLFKSRLPVTPGFSTDDRGGGDNQLFSGFARWLFPAARLELYGEYGREDHSWDKRDFVQEPDHARSYGLGVRYVARMQAARLDGVTAELINFQLPHLARTGRGEGSIYLHSVLRQGHTHRGQPLGADVGSGAAAGLVLRWDAYFPAGSQSLGVRRTVLRERGDFFQTGVVDRRSPNVSYAVEWERRHQLGAFELSTGLALIREFNRHFRSDEWDLSTSLGVRIPFAPGR